MTKTNINLVLSQELLDRVDEARGDVPRVRWVRRAVERELSRAGTDAKLREALAPAAEEMLGRPLPKQDAVVPVFRRGSARRDVKPFQRGDK